MTSDMTLTLTSHIHRHTHIHTLTPPLSLEACDLCPPSDPKVHLMLDLVGVGASAPRFLDLRGGW